MDLRAHLIGYPRIGPNRELKWALEKAWSGRMEADAFAARFSDARSLAEALVTLYKDNATTLTPDPLYSAFHDSHPPPAARIARLRSLGGRGPSATVSS